jgi:hypothetical protein
MLKLFNEEKAQPSSGADYGSLTVAVPNTTRKQVMFASGQIYTWRGIRVRELWTYGFSFHGTLDAALGMRFLTETDRMLPMGSWVVMNGGGDLHYLAFEAFIPIDANAASVQSYMNDAAQRADKLELELTSKDDM